MGNVIPFRPRDEGADRLVDMPDDFLDEDRLLQMLAIPKTQSEIKDWGSRASFEITRIGELEAVRNILEAAGFGKFVASNGTDVSALPRDKLSLCQELSPFDVVVDLRSLQSQGRDLGLSRWLALGFAPEVLSDDGGDSFLVRMTAEFGFLRFCNGCWYCGKAMDGFGKVSPWTAVHPNRLDFSNFK